MTIGLVTPHHPNRTDNPAKASLSSQRVRGARPVPDMARSAILLFLLGLALRNMFRMK